MLLVYSLLCLTDSLKVIKHCVRLRDWCLKKILENENFNILGKRESNEVICENALKSIKLVQIQDSVIINVVVWGPILSEIDIWLKICGLPEAGNDPRSFLSLGPRAGDGHRVGPRSLAG